MSTSCSGHFLSICLLFVAVAVYSFLTAAKNFVKLIQYLVHVALSTFQVSAHLQLFMAKLLLKCSFSIVYMGCDICVFWLFLLIV